MSLNRVIAIAVLCALLVQVAPVAVAQTQSPGSDLVAVSLDLGRSVADLPTRVELKVKNQGLQEFSSSSGWQVYFTYGATLQSSSCIVASPVPENTVCYQRVPGNDARSQIRPGETVTIAFDWTPSSDVHAGSGKIWTTIRPFGCTSQPNPVTCPSTGPDSRVDNNVVDFSVFVKHPGVRAAPVRDPAPDTSAPNRAWKYEDVKEPCPTPPALARTGCQAKPGTVVEFAYNVINQGNAPDSFTASLIDSSPTTQQTAPLDARGYRVLFVPDPVAIPAGEMREVRVQVVVPETERTNNFTNVNDSSVLVEWKSNLNPAVTSASPLDDDESPQGCTDSLRDLGLCTNPSFPSLLVAPDYGLNLTSNETYRLVRSGGSQAVFNMTINNTGNFNDVYRVEVLWDDAEINASWTDENRRPPPTFVSVPAFGLQNTSIVLMPPNNATKGLHAFDVSVTSLGDVSGKVQETMRFHADLEQRFGLTGRIPNQLIRVVPAEAASYVVEVENTGNGLDNVTIALENVPFGWSAVLSNRTLAVPAHGKSTFFLNVTTPANTMANSEARFFVNVTSQGPPHTISDLRPRANLSATLTVLRGPNIELTPINCPTQPCSAFIDPGESRSFELVVRNTGNVRDNFSIVAERAQGDLAWSADVTPKFAVLDPLQSQTVKVTLTAPNGGVVGETTKVFANIKSNVDPSRFEQLTIEGRVSGPDLFVSSVTSNSTNPYSGDPIELNVVLGNAGNKAPEGPVLLKVYWVPEEGSPQPIAERTYQPDDLIGGRRIAETIRWDSTGVEGAGTVLVRFDEDDAILEIDETEASNEATRPLLLRVFGIRLVPAEPLAARPGEKVSYTDSPHVFLVEYTGNQPTEPVDIYVESENGWGQSRMSLALPQGSVIPILADIRVPLSPGVAQDTLRVTIVPTLRPASAVTASTTTRILDDEKPRILGVTVTPDTLDLGEEATIRADLTDATGFASVRAFVVTPTNETQTFLLQRGEDGGWTHTQRWTLAGIHRVFIEAIDGSDSANKNSSRETLVSFTVNPGSAPVIALADGQPTTIRTGALVRLSITDPLGIAKASYSIRGVSYDLPRPFSIDTSSFSPGTVDVTVAAENIYGVESTSVFTLTVDNTPPGIRGVTFTPEKPRANEDVTLRIETDANVEAVDVLIKRDGQVIETRQAERKGSGVFEILLNPDVGDYEIDVTAKDEAGNTKLSERAAIFTAKPGSPFDVPAPGLLLVLAGVAVALLARRR